MKRREVGKVHDANRHSSCSSPHITGMTSSCGAHVGDEKFIQHFGY